MGKEEERERSHGARCQRKNRREQELRKWRERKERNRDIATNSPDEAVTDDKDGQ